MRAVIRLAWAALAVAAAGCGAGGDRVHVAGKVTVGGNPLAEGIITFEPDATQGNTGPQGFAKVENGEYDTRASGFGVTPGANIIVVTGGGGQARPDPDGRLPPGPGTFSTKVTIATDQREYSLDTGVPAGK